MITDTGQNGSTRKIKDGSPLCACGYFFSILYALLIMIPLYFVIVSAFKNNRRSSPRRWPFLHALILGKFIQAQANVNLLHAIVISTVITIGAELVTVLIAFPAAYAVARIETRLSGGCRGDFQPWVSHPRAGDL